MLWVQKSSVSHVINDNRWEEVGAVALPVLVLLLKNVVVSSCVILPIERVIHTIHDFIVGKIKFLHFSSRSVFVDVVSAESVDFMHVRPPLPIVSLFLKLVVEALFPQVLVEDLLPCVVQVVVVESSVFAL